MPRRNYSQGVGGGQYSGNSKCNGRNPAGCVGGNGPGNNGRQRPTPTINHRRWPGQPIGDATNDGILNRQDMTAVTDCLYNQNCHNELSYKGFHNAAQVTHDYKRVGLTDVIGIANLIDGGPYGPR